MLVEGQLMLTVHLNVGQAISIDYIFNPTIIIYHYHRFHSY